jgi:hypothetical protein
VKYRPPDHILRDLRLLCIDGERAALDGARQRLIPAGQLLIELEESGWVDRHGGWYRYCESGKCQEDTGIRGTSSYIYRFIKAAEWGIPAFERALSRAEQEQIGFGRESGIDWMMAVMRWDRGEPPQARKRRQSREERERILLRLVRAYRTAAEALVDEMRKVVDAGLWSDVVLNRVIIALSDEDDSFNADGLIPISSEAPASLIVESGEVRFDPNTSALPQWMFDQLNSHWDCTHDVAALPHNAKLPQFLCPPYGLHDWPNPTEIRGAYCNPPFDDILRWVGHGWVQIGRGVQLIMFVLRNDPTTLWYRRYAGRAYEIWFIGHRIRFIGQPYAAKESHIVMIFKTGSEGPPTYRNWRPVAGKPGGEFF